MLLRYASLAQVSVGEGWSVSARYLKYAWFMVFAMCQKSMLRTLSSNSSGGIKRKRDDVSEVSPEKGGTHSYKIDPRNEEIHIGIRDGVNDKFDFVWRPDAKVSSLYKLFGVSSSSAVKCRALIDSRNFWPFLSPLPWPSWQDL